MPSESISRTSSTVTMENFRVGSFSGSETESDARAHQLSAISEEGTVRDGQSLTPMQFESNSLKKKILKFFCCA